MAQTTSAYPAVPKPESVAPRRLDRPESCGSCCSREAGNCGTWALVKRDALWDGIKRFVKAVAKASFAQILSALVCLTIGFFAVYGACAIFVRAPYAACTTSVAAQRALCVTREEKLLIKENNCWREECEKALNLHNDIMKAAIPLRCDTEYPEAPCLWSFPAYFMVAHFDISTVFTLALALGVELAPYKFIFVYGLYRVLDYVCNLLFSGKELGKEVGKKLGKKGMDAVHDMAVQVSTAVRQYTADAEPPALEQVQPAAVAAPVQTHQPAQDTVQHIPQPAQQRPTPTPTPSAPVDDTRGRIWKQVSSFYTKPRARA